MSLARITIIVGLIYSVNLIVLLAVVFLNMVSTGYLRGKHWVEVLLLL